MSQRLKSLLLLVCDLIIMVGALNITLFIFKKGIYVPSFWEYHIDAFSWIFPVWVILFYVEGLYSLKTSKNTGLAISLLRPIFIGTIFSFVYFYLFMSEIAPRKNLIILGAMSFAGMFLIRKFFLKLFSADTLTTKVLLIGTAEDAASLENELIERKYLGYKIIKTLPDCQNLDTSGAELVVVDRTNLRNETDLKTIFNLLGEEINVMELADFSEQTTGKIPLNAIEESWFIQYCGIQKNKGYEFLKNLIDRGTALILILLIGPFYLLLLLLLLMVHGRPIFFTQIRSGHFNRPFRLFKLRSMVVDAEKAGAMWSKPGDSRITTIGKFLRKTRLDELPQLWNIFKGDMSLVGPRPERPEMIEKELSPKIPFYNQRHLVKPGVTGWAQVNFRYGYSTNDSMEKLQYDLYYIKNKSIWLDVSIILKTIKTVVTGAGQ